MLGALEGLAPKPGPVRSSPSEAIYGWSREQLRDRLAAILIDDDLASSVAAYLKTGRKLAHTILNVESTSITMLGWGKGMRVSEVDLSMFRVALDTHKWANEVA